MKNPSKVIKCHDYKWETVERRQYKTDVDTFKDIHRYSLLGEREDEQQLNFQTRYFEIQPGGYSTLEYHRHPHSVVIIRGSGSLVLHDEVHELGLHDVVFIAPDTLHQFLADKGDPLGFLCIVDRYRDRPSLPDDQYLDEHLDDTEARQRIRR